MQELQLSRGKGGLLAPVPDQSSLGIDPQPLKLPKTLAPEVEALLLIFLRPEWQG